MRQPQEETLKELMVLIPALVEEKFRRGDAEHGGNLTDMPISEELNELTEELVDALIFVLDISKKIRKLKTKWNHLDKSLEDGSTTNGQSTPPTNDG